MYNNCSTRGGETVSMLLSNVLDTKEEGVGGGITLPTIGTLNLKMWVLNPDFRCIVQLN